MATKFGRIDYADSNFTETVFYKNQSFTSASDGISVVHLRQGDRVNNNWDEVPDSPLSVSGSHWAFVHGNFYLSGSIHISSSYPADVGKLNSIYHRFNEWNDSRPFHTNKFHSTGSVIYIPQQYFGERIKSGSFQLTARTGSSDNETSQIIIKDDGDGNLYSTNPDISSSNTSLTSSENYIGNIFYDLGVATITETGSVFHTPSTASITVQAFDSSGAGDATASHFYISASDDSYALFISTGSGDPAADDVTTAFNKLYYFGSGSSTAITAISASQKINQVFSGSWISASANSNVINLTNDYNQLIGDDESTKINNLPPISGSGGFATITGFGGGSAAVKYTDIGSTYNDDNRLSKDYRFWSVDFNSTLPTFTSQYSVKISADQFNNSVNHSTRKFYTPSASFSLPAGADISDYINLRNNLTGSGWSPYFTQLNLFRNQSEDALITCNLPRAIKKRNDIDLIITFRIDH